MRRTKRFASVAVRQSCQSGRPKRRVSSSAASIAASDGSMVVAPFSSCAAIARVSGAGAWPAMAAVSPRARSRYWCPSTSVIVAPRADAAYGGTGEAHRCIQLIGTPPTRLPLARSASSAARGCARANRSDSSPKRRARCSSLIRIRALTPGCYASLEMREAPSHPAAERSPSRACACRATARAFGSASSLA